MSKLDKYSNLSKFAQIPYVPKGAEPPSGFYSWVERTTNPFSYRSRRVGNKYKSELIYKPSGDYDSFYDYIFSTIPVFPAVGPSNYVRFVDTGEGKRKDVGINYSPEFLKLQNLPNYDRGRYIASLPYVDWHRNKGKLTRLEVGATPLYIYRPITTSQRRNIYKNLEKLHRSQIKEDTINWLSNLPQPSEDVLETVEEVLREYIE